MPLIQKNIKRKIYEGIDLLLNFHHYSTLIVHFMYISITTLHKKKLDNLNNCACNHVHPKD